MKPILAHKGDTQSFKENTLPAFLSAFGKGATGIEMDIHYWKGEIIVVHDYLFDRSVNYPKLADILSQLHTKGRLEIEIKEVDAAILQPLKTILDLYPKTDFELTTEEIPLLLYIKQIMPDKKTGMNIGDKFFEDWMTGEIAIQKIVGWGKMSKVDVIHLPFYAVQKYGDQWLAKQLHEAGFKVHVHIPSDNKQQVNFILANKWGIDQCSIDDLLLLR